MPGGVEGSECFLGTECQFGKVRKSWRGRWQWLHNSVNVPNASELDPKNGEDVTF